jgi:hypothetical protein
MLYNFFIFVKGRKNKEKMPKFYFFSLLLHCTVVLNTDYETITLNAQKWLFI